MSFDDAGRERELAVELATELSTELTTLGLYERAAEVRGYVGLAAPEPAADVADIARVAALLDAQLDADLAFQSEAYRPRARRSEGDRMSAALERLQNGTLVPADPSARWQHSPGLPGPVTAEANCGPSDPHNGLCTSRYHDMGCGSSADPEIARGLIESGQYRRIAERQHVDESGHVWESTTGSPMTLTGLVESSTGVRLGDGVETGLGRREVLVAQSQQRWGDPDDPDDAGEDIYSPAVATVRDQLGLTSRTADDARAIGRQRRDAQIVSGRRRGSTHADFGEGRAERAERMKFQHPADVVRADDGDLHGAVPTYTTTRG